MSDRMAATMTVPTWALALPTIQSVLSDEPPDDQLPNPDGTTDVIQFEAPWGEWPNLENALIAAGIAFDRHSDGLYEYNPETRFFRPAQDGLPACDVTVPTLTNGTPVMPWDALQQLAQEGPLTLDRLTAALGLPAVSVAEWGHTHAPPPAA